MGSIQLDNDNKPWHRRIVICCDGTWQSSVALKENVPSNVTKLCRHIARIGYDKDDPTKRFNQLVYYDSGIGTGNLSSSERKRQGGLGAGLAENVIEAYNFIVLNYAPGDEIFCFGFSRGAYTARAVAGLVTDIGVISPLDMQFFPEIYRAYMHNDEGVTFTETDAWKNFLNGPLSHRRHEPLRGDAKKLAESWGGHTHGDLAVTPESRKVKIVGVFDTVGSLGIPDVAFFDNANFRTQYGFHNVRLNENIEHAFHALALDEKRKAFRPTLWYIDHDLIRSGKPIPELKQVWFPGVHINSGGGADDAISDMKGDLEHLSVASFCWMLQCISPHLTIDQDAFHATTAQYMRWLATIRTSCTYYHDDWLDWVQKKLPSIPFLNSSTDHLEPPPRSEPHAHPEFDYGWGTGPIVDSYTGMYKLAGAYPRVPGHCEAEIYDASSHEHKLSQISAYGHTNEYIHPICHYRDLVRGPEPQSALRDFDRTFVPGPGGKGRFWWLKKGDAEDRRLPEWVIMEDGPTLNFERHWYANTEKSAAALERLRKNGYPRDWLEMVDEKVDFALGKSMDGVGVAMRKG